MESSPIYEDKKKRKWKLWNHIRLLTLQPTRSGIPTSDDIVKCRLDAYKYSWDNLLTGVQPLDRLPHEVLSKHRYPWGDYVAISHVWGTEPPSRRIEVNGHTVLVRENLEAALKVLRDSPEAVAGIKFWVDTLSINQEDELERGFEIGSMRDIFVQARRVLAWLGPVSCLVKGSIVLDDQDIEYLNGQIGLRTAKDSMSNQVELGLTYPAIVADADLQQSLKTLGIRCHRPFWRRLWIVQELVLGGRDTILLCGPHRLIWSDFGSLVWSTQLLRVQQKKRYKEDTGADLHWDSIFHVAELYCTGVIRGIQSPRRHKLLLFPTSTNAAWGDERGKSWESNLKLSGLPAALGIYYSLSCQATQPRDKVYGILGLLERRVRSYVNPSLRASLLEVYREIAIAIMIVEHSPNTILRAASFTSEARPAGWPSWIPDLSQSPRVIDRFWDEKDRTTIWPQSTDFEFATPKFDEMKISGLTVATVVAGTLESPLSNLYRPLALQLVFNNGFKASLTKVGEIGNAGFFDQAG